MAKAADNANVTGNSHWNVVLVCSIALLLLSKFFLVYEDEIIARHSPNDNSWFIRAADFLIKGQWLGPYEGPTLVRPPGYPLAIWWNHLTGLPLRLAHELWLMAGALYFAFSFRLPKYSRTLRWVFTALIVFHPTSFWVGREAEGENFYLPMYLVLIGSLVRHFYVSTLGSRIFYSLLTGISLAFLALTREEGKLLLGVGSIFAVLLWISLRSANLKERAQSVLLAVSIPLLFYAGSIQALRWMNDHWYGVAIFSERRLEGPKRLGNAFQKIQPVLSPRYVAVTKETRKLAYKVSPTFRKIEGLLEGDFGEFWRKVGCQMGADCQDLSAGWIGAAMTASLTELGLAKTAVETDAFYHQAADEIEDACRKGTLKCSKNTVGILGFLYRALRWDYFWPSVKKIGGMLAPITPFPQSVDQSQPEIIELYDRVANRRRPVPTLFSRSGEIAGWAYAVDPWVRIEAVGPGDRIYGHTETFFEREDATRRLREVGFATSPVDTGFMLRVDIDSGTAVPLQLRLSKASGRTLSKPALPFYEELSDQIVAIDSVKGMAVPWRIQVPRGMAKGYRWLVEIFSVLAGITLVLYPFLKKRPVPSHFWPISILLLSAVASRFFPLVLLDAVMYPIIETALRYSYPIVAIYACLIVWIFLGLIPSMARAGREDPIR